MRQIVTVIICTVAMFFAGCAKQDGLKFTDRPQNAVFHISYGWTGGMGSMPVIDPASGGPISFNGIPVFFDESKRETIEGKLPASYYGTPRIKISAEIILVKKEDTNASLPIPSKQSYYEAVVTNPNNLEIKVIEK